MFTLKGKGVCPGIVMGNISFFKRDSEMVKRIKISNTAAEIMRVEDAKKNAVEELKVLYDKALKEVGEANAQIFDIHQMMLEDLDYNDSITNIIETQEVNAEYAVAITADNFAMMFSSMEDEYMRARAADVRDISNRLIKCLSGQAEVQTQTGKSIICADDLAPSETVQMDKERVLAFVTAHGSANSHTAILARTMGIPAIIGVGDDLCETLDGKSAIVDGLEGIIYIEPDDATIKRMNEKLAHDKEQKELMKALKGKETVSIDGREIKLYANIGGISDIGAVLLNDAEGVGLFRSEFLYLENSDFPSEEQQFAAYKKVIESMAGKKVIIRTLDIGADKQIDYFGLPQEENPALGYRAIRICLQQQEIFKTQLRSLFRASAFGNLAIMFPMIISVDEIVQIKKVVETVKDELNADGIPFSDKIELGIMIETPAAVMISDQLAAHVDFFSIGTNDLTQYTLAIDRQNPKLEAFFDPYHPAVKRMIKLVVDNAHKAGIWAGVCGELGGDSNMTEWFLWAGVDELSVSPPLVLEVRKKIRETDTTKLQFAE